MSAVGTALGPTLGGFLISAFNWRAIFLINIPLGLTALYLALRYLPADQKLQNTQRPKFDNVGTSLLAVSLVIYAMAMTLGHGHYGVINLLLLLGAFAGAGLFIFAESKAKSPLIKLSMFRNRVLSIGISVNVLVISVMMATLVVGPFYLSRALGLDVAKVGLVVSIGPIVAALSGIPAGRLVDRFGASGIASIGLIGLATGSLLLSLTSITLGVIGYVLPIAIITSSFALFQAANNTAVMTNIDQSQRGLISGILNLSRNLGLITGTSVMGAIFAFASNTSDLTSAHPGEVAKGMHITFLIAAILMLLGLLLMTNLNLSKRRKKILSRYETEDTTLIERARYLLIHWRCLLGYC